MSLSRVELSISLPTPIEPAWRLFVFVRVVLGRWDGAKGNWSIDRRIPTDLPLGTVGEGEVEWHGHLIG